jgi:TPR repeat protein
MLHRRPDSVEQEPGRNRVDAIGWLQRAAHQGLPRAQLKLAEVYADPPQSRGDAVRACTWFRVAMGSTFGVHRHQAKAGYDRVAAALSPGQLRQAEREARAVQRSLLSASVGIG